MGSSGQGSAPDESATQRVYAHLRICALDRPAESRALADRTLPIPIPSPVMPGSFVDHPMDAVLVTDESGTIVFASEGACGLFQYSAEELRGWTIELLIPHRSRTAHIGQRLRFTDERRTRPMGTGLELFALCKDGSERRVDISLRTVQRGLQILTVATIRPREQAL